MNSNEFCYWLQGFFELQEPASFNEKQTILVKKHLELVFTHDPSPAPFCCFLNGYFKVTKPQVINTHETVTIKQYLYNVFEHVVEEPAIYHKPGMQLQANDVSELIKC